jgi:glycosyltransferase involved in cell wall biosynthesis
VYKTNLEDEKKLKIAFITNIPTPYRRKQWEYYSKCECFDITVFYCSQSEKDRNWDMQLAEGTKEVFLKGLSYRSFHFNLEVIKVIFEDYDLFFVGGYGYPSVLMSILTLRLLKKPWVMMIDGISPLKLKKENYIAENIKKLLIQGANAYFANGTVGYRLLEKYGVNPKNIFNQYMTVDVDYFTGKVIDSVRFRKELRQKYGMSEDSIVVLYVGRLIENKGVQDLIRAIKSLKNKNLNIKALIVGEGNFKEELKKQSEALKHDILFTGHIDPEDLYKYYYTSDIFVLPTYDDKWGLVVNEAMACGLPIIVTDAAGCSLDLLRDNGIIVQKGNVHQLSFAIESLTKKDLRKQYGASSLRIISKWSYKQSLDSFSDIIQFVRRNRK